MQHQIKVFAWDRNTDNSHWKTAKLAGMVRRQAMTMAIADVFFLLTILFFGITLLLPLMRKPAAVGGSGH
ncbi:MAG: hypothetical protein WCE69_06725 [Aestuariivirga sp.]